MFTYNFLIRFALEAAILSFLSIALQLYDFKISNFKIPIYAACYILTFLLSLAYGIVLFQSFYLLKRDIKVLKRQETKDKIGAFYEELDLDTKNSLTYSPMFFVRRL